MYDDFLQKKIKQHLNFDKDNHCIMKNHNQSNRWIKIKEVIFIKLLHLENKTYHVGWLMIYLCYQFILSFIYFYKVIIIQY